MKNFLNKTLLAAAVTAAVALASGSAAAVSYLPFTVNEAAVPGTSSATYLPRADLGTIGGTYNETVTFTPTTAGSGTFVTRLVFNASNFTTSTGAPQNGFALNAIESAGGYQLYSVFSASGTFGPNSGNSAQTDFAFTSGSLQAYIDPNSDTKFDLATGTIPSVGAADLLLATGSILNGTGNQTPGPNCGPTNGINCGSFGITTSFELTNFGRTYFTQPIPFYNVSFDSGNFNFLNTGIATPQQTAGVNNLTFRNAVPEPESLALFGIGLLGLGSTMRRRKQAKV